MTKKRGIKDQIKRMIEDGKTDEEIVNWIRQELPHVKDPAAYLRAVKSSLRKEKVKEEMGIESTAPIIVEQQAVQVSQEPGQQEIQLEVESAEQRPIPLELSEETLAAIYRSVFSVIGIAVGKDIELPEHRARARAELLKKVIEKHGLTQLPFEELGLVTGLAEDAFWLYRKIREDNVKAEVSTNQEERQERKEEKKKTERRAINLDTYKSIVKRAAAK